MPEFAEEILGMPVRLGTPVGIEGITQLVQAPQWATGVGLVRYGAQALRERGDVLEEDAPTAPVLEEDEDKSRRKEKGGPSRFWQWFREAF
jgi:cell division protein FtsA